MHFCPSIQNRSMSQCYDPHCHRCFLDHLKAIPYHECVISFHYHYRWTNLIQDPSHLIPSASLLSQVLILHHHHFHYLDPPPEYLHCLHDVCYFGYCVRLPSAISLICALHWQYCAPSSCTCTQLRCRRGSHSSRRLARFPCSSDSSCSSAWF